MGILCGILVVLVLGLAMFSYLEMEMFQVSVLDRRNRRKTELAFLNENAKPGQTVFFGDSITQYCPVEEMYAEYTKKTGYRVYNRGIASETTEDGTKRLESNVLSISPRNLVILYGCNDIGKKMTIGQTVKNIKEIILRAKEKNPAIHIILQAVYPIRESEKKLAARLLIGGRDCKKIKELNASLKQLADEMKVVFVDLTELLADENGELRADFTEDGLHVNEKAYWVIAANIIPLLEKEE